MYGRKDKAGCIPHKNDVCIFLAAARISRGIWRNGRRMGRCLCGGRACRVFAETVTILLTAVLVPVSLKLFSWMLTKKIDVVAITGALRLYALWSGVRLALLAMPVLAGFLTYYMMLSNKGVLCALIALTASLFCLPGENRLRKELHIEKE